MKDIRFDEDGVQRCWNCGFKGLNPQRTLRSKVTLGVASLLTKQKLRCNRCGEYNDTGSAKPYDGPAARKYRQEYEVEIASAPSQPAPIAPFPPPG